MLDSNGGGAPVARLGKSVSRRRKLSWCAAAVIALPFLLEALVRARACAKYGSTNDVFDIYETDPLTELRSPIPGLSMTLAGGSQIEIDSRGFRSPELRVPKPEGTLRLAFLGDSTTLCVEAASNARTWPHQVRESLSAACAEVDFDYLNAAVNAYSVSDAQARFVHRVRPLDPDVVVIYLATRDIAKDTRELAIAAGLADRRRVSWLEDHSLLWHQVLLNTRYLLAQRAARTADDKLEFDPEPLARAFEARLTELVRNAQEVAGVVVVMTFATRASRAQSREEQMLNLRHAFTFTPYMTPERIFDCYDAYNRAIRDVARATGAVLVEASGELTGKPEHFVDSVHFAELGFAAMARLVSEGLLASPAFRALVDGFRASATERGSERRSQR